MGEKLIFLCVNHVIIYNLLTEKKYNKIHAFEVLTLLSISRNSLEIQSLDDIFLKNFALSN